MKTLSIWSVKSNNIFTIAKVCKYYRILELRFNKPIIMKNTFLFGLAFSLLVVSCGEHEATEKVIGLKPVYGNIDDLSKLIKTTESEPMKAVGKIYVYGNQLLINEIGKGVHVFDNTDPKNPTQTKFVSIPGNIDVAIKDNFMYADMGVGLVTIDITDLDNIAITSFDQNHVNALNSTRPPAAIASQFVSERVYFECADPSKGLILNWERAEMPQPECYITQ